MGKIPTMTITADAEKRVRLGLAKPGDRFDVQVTEDGAFLLRRLEPVKGVAHSKVKLIKKNGFTVGHTDKQVSPETIKELLADFPHCG
jgi:hypothetical protein